MWDLRAFRTGLIRSRQAVMWDPSPREAEEDCSGLRIWFTSGPFHASLGVGGCQGFSEQLGCILKNNLVGTVALPGALLDLICSLYFQKDLRFECPPNSPSSDQVPKRHTHVLIPQPVNLAFFGKRSFVDVIKLKISKMRSSYGLSGWALNPVINDFIKDKRREDAGRGEKEAARVWSGRVPCRGMLGQGSFPLRTFAGRGTLLTP